MKKLLLPILCIMFLLCGVTRLLSFPIYDPFNYTPGQTLWGRTDANGDFWWEIDSGQVSPPNAIVVTGTPVSYPGLPASTGNSIILSNLNGGQGARMFVDTNNTLNFFGNGAAGAPYPGPIDVLTSMVINITNMANLSTSPVFVMGYNDQGAIAVQGGNPGTVVYRIYFKSVNGTGTNYQIGVSKQGGGGGPFFATNILQTFQNVLVVMDETITNCGVGEPNSCTSDIATLWVNPPSSSFGAATEPAFSAQEGAGLEGNLTPYTSCFLFENRSTTTPNAMLVGQFRMGTNWSWVTGGPCYFNANPPTSNIFNTNFSLTVKGLDNGSPNTYQWQFNGTNLANGPSISGSGSTISGATTTNLTVTKSTGPDGGTYSLIVSNSVGFYSNVVSTVSVFQPEPPSITTEPGPAVIPLYSGGSDVVSFTTQGSPPITYYWSSNSQVVAVTTNVSLFMYSNLTANATVSCLASNAFGTTNTSSLSIQIQPAPTTPYVLTVINDKPIDFWPLNEHPDNGSGDIGTTAIDYMGGNDGVYNNVDLNLSGYGTGLASQYGYTPATDSEVAAEFGFFPSFPATNSVIGGIQNINFTTPQDSPPFSVEAWVNAEGNSPSIGTIIAKGSGTQSTPGDQFSLDCVAGVWQFYVRDASGIAFQVTGAASPDANWHHIVGVMNTPIAMLFLYVDGNLVSSNGYAFSAGTNTIGIENIAQPVTIGSAGSSLTVTNDKNWEGKLNNVAIYGYALSASQVSNHYYAAGIAPSIFVQPMASTNINPGNTVTAGVVAHGTPLLSYQWIDGNANNSPIAGQTNAILLLNNVTNSDSYYVVVSNAYGTATSSPISVAVAYAPTIVQDITPSSTYVVVGSTLPFSVGVDGAPPINYSWAFNNGTNTVTLANGTRISGANSNLLTISDVQLSDAGTYQLSASNSFGGPVNSSAAQVNVASTLSFFDESGNGFVSESSPANALLWFAPDGGVFLTSNLGEEATSTFYQSPVYIGAFQASFNYTLASGTNANAADGVTFCIQNDPRGAAAVGGNGASLGVGSSSPVTPSVELELNIFEGNGIGGAGIAFATNGAIASVRSTSPVFINSGDAITVNLTYLNNVLTINLDDAIAGTQFTMSTNVNIPARVGGHNTAYVGFTGADGGSKSSQLVTDFSFISIPTLTITASSNQAVISWPSAVGNYILQQSSSLVSPNWTPVANPVTPVNGQNQVTVSPGGSANFYRLSLQQ